MLIAWGLPDVLGKGRYKNMMLTMLAGVVLVIIFASQDKFDEAISLFEQAININSEHAHAHFNLGSLLVKQGKFKSADRHCAEAIRIKPDYAEAYYQIGNILTQQGKLEEANIFFSKAIQLKPSQRPPVELVA
ncbi:tetratricopeptide repeat protein [Thermodesulfobacteriota bacterium]